MNIRVRNAVVCSNSCDHQPGQMRKQYARSARRMLGVFFQSLPASQKALMAHLLPLLVQVAPFHRVVHPAARVVEDNLSSMIQVIPESNLH